MLFRSLDADEFKLIQRYREDEDFAKGLVAKKAGASDKELQGIVRKMLSKSAMTTSSIAKALDTDTDTVRAVLEDLDVEFHGGMVTLNKPGRGEIPLDIFGNGWQTFGLVADTHLGSRLSREAELHATYKIFEREGITQVFHAGNLVDGYVQRINGSEVHCSSIDDQTQYAIDNYPRIPGITTNYITGDDHEGWWQKEGFNWGKYLEMLAREQGREDLRYIGHVEGDVELRHEGGTAVMKIQHPGGGSAYARSYTQQKQIEAFEGGEKPQILIQGHYHVSNHMHDRGVHVVSMPGFQDQTIFARKKRLRMEVGGAIMRFQQNPRRSEEHTSELQSH